MTVPVLLDAATGTELARRGVRVDGPLGAAAAVREAPATLREIHREHLLAGAQVLTTATLCAHALDATTTRDLATAAVRLCREAIARAPARIAGAIGPRPGPAAEAAPRYRQLARALVDAGCDLLLVETMIDPQHAAAAVGAAREVAAGRPVWLAIACGTEGALLGGASIHALFDRLDVSVLGAILVGCTERAALGPALDAIAGHRPAQTWWGAVPNAGRTVAGRHRPNAESDAAIAEHLLELATRHRLDLLGGCCGTGPTLIEALRRGAQPTASDRAHAWARLVAARRA